MAIHVTPIPKLTPFATPDLTLTTANGAGSAGVATTIRSDASILVYDTSVPAAVSTASATGSAATAARRDHVHAGLVDVGVRVKDASTQSIATATDTKINFDQEDFDTDGMHDNSTNNTRLTCKIAGKYVLGGQVAIASGSGYRMIEIRLNNSTTIAYQSWGAISGGDGCMEVVTTYDLDVDDYVELRVAQYSGGALNSTLSFGSPRFWAQLVG